MTEVVSEARDDPPGEIGLFQVKCNDTHLYKIDFNGGRMVEVPLSDIRHVTYQRRFHSLRLLTGILFLALAALCFVYLTTGWAKWTAMIFLALIAFSYFSEINDQSISVSSKHGKFTIDVNEVENPSDVEAFVATVRMKMKEAEERGS